MARDIPPDPSVDAAPPDVAPDPVVDAPPPVNCVDCVTQCLSDNCPGALVACELSQCAPLPAPDAGPSDAGGDAFFPPACPQIVQCLIQTQCNPLNPTDPCFLACYSPACAEAKAAFDVVLTCAVNNCVADCAGCQ
jgi:hypothetical protein